MIPGFDIGIWVLFCFQTDVECFLSKASEIAVTSELTDADAVNLLLLKQELNIFLNGTKDCEVLG